MVRVSLPHLSVFGSSVQTLKCIKVITGNLKCTRKLCSSLTHVCVRVLQTVGELWLVTEDVVSTRAGELSVSRGQHVEVVDTSPSGAPPDLYLIRPVPPPPAAPDSAGPPGQPAPAPEGLVPAAALRPVSTLRTNSAGVYSSPPPENEGKALLCLRVFLLPFFISFILSFSFIHTHCLSIFLCLSLSLSLSHAPRHPHTLVCLCLSLSLSLSLNHPEKQSQKKKKKKSNN